MMNKRCTYVSIKLTLEYYSQKTINSLVRAERLLLKQKHLQFTCLLNTQYSIV